MLLHRIMFNGRTPMLICSACWRRGMWAHPSQLDAHGNPRSTSGPACDCCRAVDAAQLPDLHLSRTALHRLAA